MAELFDAVDVIIAKRDGEELSGAQIDWVIDGFVRGVVADEQMSALAMAILLNGMTAAETARWTTAMIASGSRLDFTDLGRPAIDKHSTGGVGDKITLPLVPVAAACGLAVPQLSGRGLGHTGGTLDKLESIPGWRASLELADIRRQLAEVGGVICSATGDLAPADRLLYALRDVTGTVESIPLIASSIMSKKIAEGAGGLVLDVKAGRGAFMKTEQRARELAETMVEIGRSEGLSTTALITDMDVPLGRAVGNALEVAEAVEVLAGAGPADVVELTIALAEEMLTLAGVVADPDRVLRDGSAMDVWRTMITAQGGDPDRPLPRARHEHVLTAQSDGLITDLDAFAIGVAAWRLGAGRARKGDPVNHGAGVLIDRAPGDFVRRGDPVLRLRFDDETLLERALEVLRGAWRIGPEHNPVRRSVLLGRVD